VCLAFGIDFVVLHDEDIYPEEGDNQSKAKVRAQNDEHRKVNSDIAALATGENQLFVITPSLEGVLGIGRSATDKPRRIAVAVAGLLDVSLSAELNKAVTALSA
jgi:hypothetical protein